MAKRHLLIGADPFPPYQYFDSAGVIRGEDYEKVKDAGIKAGFELEFIIDDWALIEQTFSEKKLDAVFQLPKTPEREAKYLFSKLLRNGKTEIVTGHPDLEIVSVSEIDSKNHTIGLVAGISYGDDILSLNQKSKKFYQSNDELLSSIGRREVDFGVFDEGVKRFLMEKLSIGSIRAIDALTFLRPLFIAFHDLDIKTQFDKYL
jgi:polar amino acid transport system substrate-binding protein